MTTRQTLRDYLTSIGSSATGISIPIEPGPNGVVDLGDDVGKEPNTGRDLLDLGTSESLLGDYLSFITKKNAYTISPGAHESVSPHRGAALSPAETASAPEVFADSRVGTNAASLNRSNSMRFDAAGQPLTTIIDKLGNGTAASGNELLPSTVAAAASSDAAPNQTPAVKGAFSSLKKYNYFSPTSSPASFARDDTGSSITPDEFENTRHTRFQIGKGEYSIEETEISAEIVQKDLANIARSMILKSAGWDDTTRPADAQDPDTAFTNISESTLTRFPEIVKDNVGVVDAFRAQDSYGFPSNPDGTSVLSDRGSVLTKNYDEAIYTRTRGGTHAPDQPFGESPNSDNRIQSLQAGLSMIGLAALIDKKMINISQIIKDLQLTNDTVIRGPYYLGTSTKSDLQAKTRAFVRTFMFETGIYSYEKCVSEGLYACFGYNTATDRTDTSSDDSSTFNIATSYAPLIKKIANDLDKDFYDSPMGLSQGFWRAISESALRAIKEIRRSTQANDGSDYIQCLLQMKDALAVRVMKVFASIGYQRLTIQGLSTAEIKSGDPAQNPYGIDDYPNTPGTRQMKSRDGQLLNKSSLAWRNSALPSAFILPLEALAASLDADYIFDKNRGSNPIVGMLGSTLYDKTYVKSTPNAGAIPSSVAKALEDRLGAEYIPFYFRDLRTNEIIAFHAFLDNYTDGLRTSYTETRGFGRSEAVYNYNNTSRSMSISFTLVATSKEDFDEMWFKINKLTTLAYPQYTRGRTVSSTDTGTLVGKVTGNLTANFEQPFSQLVGGTPVVRIRLGDVVRTNYTRSNLGRLFGVGNDTFKATSVDITAGETLGDKTRKTFDDLSKARRLGESKVLDAALLPFLAYAGSPMEARRFTGYIDKLAGLKTGILSAGADVTEQLASSLLVNGFVNPSLYEDRTRVLNRPRRDFGGVRNFIADLASNGVLKPRSTPYLVTVGDKQKYVRLLRPVFVTLKEGAEGRTGEVYKVEFNDATVGEDLNGGTCSVSTADLYIDASRMVDLTSFPGILLTTGAVLTSSPSFRSGTGLSNFATTQFAGLTQGVSAELPVDDVVGSFARSFIAPVNNSITRAFEDRMGEGLACVIKGLTFTWIDIPWELDWNSRAPRACKIQVQFDPIHDIAPGLDSNGFNRAPIYNVGQIMHDTFGHPRSDGGLMGEFYYKQGGAVAETATQPTIQQRALEKK